MFHIVVMTLLLIVGVFKLILVIVICIIFLVSKASRRYNRRKQRNATKGILRGLAKIKYSALVMNAVAKEDEECSICFCEYIDEDIVTKLSCNEKHIFHEECISSWIKQGKNSCPICRAPIN